MPPADLIESLLKYGAVPLWLAAGLADWFCHRASAIERTSGPTESLLHIAQFCEIGVGLVALLFLEIGATVFVLLLACLVAHELTAIWDVRYASGRRRVSPVEQHVHGVLENLPFAALALLAVAHWPDFAAVLRPDEWLRPGLRPDPLASRYVWGVAVAVTLFVVLPYGEELVRTIRNRR
jgi:hypothetical protein